VIFRKDRKYPFPKNTILQWFPKYGAPPPWGAQEILKGGGARGAKLFYSLKINKKHKYNLKNLRITIWSFK
jgi:hypothetical protein